MLCVSVSCHTCLGKPYATAKTIEGDIYLLPIDSHLPFDFFATLSQSLCTPRYTYFIRAVYPLSLFQWHLRLLHTLEFLISTHEIHFCVFQAHLLVTHSSLRTIKLHDEHPLVFQAQPIFVHGHSFVASLHDSHLSLSQTQPLLKQGPLHFAAHEGTATGLLVGFTTGLLVGFTTGLSVGFTTGLSVGPSEMVCRTYSAESCTRSSLRSTVLRVLKYVVPTVFT